MQPARARARAARPGSGRTPSADRRRTSHGSDRRRRDRGERARARGPEYVVRPHPYRDRTMFEGTWTLRPCPHRLQTELARELGISELTAGVLIRRGYTDPENARAFLDGAYPPHDPFLLGDMRGACERIRAAVAAGTRICVHGDYDVDGIAATALAVLLLRELGADVEWHLPSRFDEGYGVSSSTLGRLADAGCGLVLTVDCGITAAAEVRS